MNHSAFFLLILAHLIAAPGFTQTKHNTYNQYRLIVGTYTNSGKSDGIYSYRFNGNSGEAVFLSKTTTADPSYLVMGNKNHFVYAVNELGGGKGSISAFSYQHSNGEISLGG